MLTVHAKDVMSSPAITVGPDEPLKHVAGLMTTRNIRAVPVVDAEGRPLGVLSESDLLRVLSAGRTRTPRTASEAMTSPAVSVNELATLAHVTSLMVDRHVKHVVVVAGSRVVGIVSRHDVIKTMCRSDEEIDQQVRALLDGEAGIIGRYGAAVSQGFVYLTGPRERTYRLVAEVLARSVPGVIGVSYREAASA